MTRPVFTLTTAAAVEAAARCMWEAMYPDVPWPDAPSVRSDHCRAMVAPYVMAAAPLIAAQALRDAAAGIESLHPDEVRDVDEREKP